MAVAGAQTFGGTRIRTLTGQTVSSRKVKNKKVARVQLVAALGLFLALIAQLWVRTQIIEQGYRLEQVRRAALEKDARLRGLNLELAYLSRPADLQAEAQKRLGMSVLLPQNLRRIVVERNATTGRQ